MCGGWTTSADLSTPTNIYFHQKMWHGKGLENTIVKPAGQLQGCHQSAEMSKPAINGKGGQSQPIQEHDTRLQTQVEKAPRFERQAGRADTAQAHPPPFGSHVKEDGSLPFAACRISGRAPSLPVLPPVSGHRGSPQTRPRRQTAAARAALGGAVSAMP